MLPRKNGDELSGELLAQGYWQTLGKNLTIAQMDKLSEMVLAKCKWFPTVAECNSIIGEQSYSNPFYREREKARLEGKGYPVLSGEQQKRLGNA